MLSDFTIETYIVGPFPFSGLKMHYQLNPFPPGGRGGEGGRFYLPSDCFLYKFSWYAGAPQNLVGWPKINGE